MSLNIDRRTTTIFYDAPYAVIRVTEPTKSVYNDWMEGVVTEGELERLIGEAKNVLETMRKVRAAKPIPGQTRIDVSGPAQEGNTT